MDGLGDRKKVTVLDFATGTGTFLLEIFQQIFDKLPVDSGKREQTIQEHLLKNIYGFEYLMAPYTIAHLKLSQYIKEKGYTLKSNERLQVFLTNTLDPVSPETKVPLLPALTQEARLAQSVKDKPILVITGNPPYSGHSKNTGKWITDRIEDYRFVDGQKLKERNPKWLQDDYVKFIRFAQYKMENVDEGVVGIITNHSFLDNPTFRGMRQSLLNTFDHLYFIDLHGSRKKKEKTPNGTLDENVFDIEQGVAISLFVKKKGARKIVKHADFWGRRKEKYQLCIEKSIKDRIWQDVQPASPFYLFIPQNKSLKEVYQKGWNVKNIYKLSGNGIVTKRDPLVVGFQRKEIVENLKTFMDDRLSDQEISELFGVPIIDKDKWDLIEARAHLKKEGILPEKIIPYAYRPFDSRYLYFDEVLVARLVKSVSSLLKTNNVGLVIGRAGQNVGDALWNLSFVTNHPVDLNMFYRGGGTIFLASTLKGGIISDNFTDSFSQFLSDNSKIYRSQLIHPYIYSVLHSTHYRERYKDFLKIDYPSIPFVKDKATFDKLSKLGSQLIEAHLLKSIPSSLNGNFLGKGKNTVEKADHVISGKSGRLYINNNKYFDLVSKEVFEFQIGGYQVLEKYLKDRKGRDLELDETETVENIIKVLTFTIEQIKKIDGLTKDWI